MQELVDAMTVRFGGRPVEADGDFVVIYSDDRKHFVTCEILADNETVSTVLRTLDSKTFPDRYKRYREALLRQVRNAQKVDG